MTIGVVFVVSMIAHPYILTGDLNRDWTVDLKDFAMFVRTLDRSGPGMVSWGYRAIPEQPYRKLEWDSSEHSCDRDQDVDLADYAVFQRMLPITQDCDGCRRLFKEVAGQ